MIETPTQISIPELEKARAEASRQERSLAQEVDSLPEKIKEAARQDARSKAAAARTGEDVAAVDEASDVNALRQREAELPFLRWSASIRTAALEVELNQAQKETQQEKADEARPLLKPARAEMEEASDRFNDIRATVLQAEGAASTFSLYASDARKRLRQIEAEYPGV
jgi:predicted  nucleic acid-binding Zn-ribbon protein